MQLFFTSVFTSVLTSWLARGESFTRRGVDKKPFANEDVYKKKRKTVFYISYFNHKRYDENPHVYSFPIVPVALFNFNLLRAKNQNMV